MKWHKFIGEYSKLPSLSRTESKNELVSDSFIVNENGENYLGTLSFKDGRFVITCVNACGSIERIALTEEGVESMQWAKIEAPF